MARDGERELIKRALQKPQATIKPSATQSDVKSTTVESSTSQNPRPETGQSVMLKKMKNPEAGKFAEVVPAINQSLNTHLAHDMFCSDDMRLQRYATAISRFEST
jgi:hypothetical protein